MNIDAKILNKVLAAEQSNASKRSYTMIKWIYSRNARLVHLQINKCDLPHKQNEG